MTFRTFEGTEEAAAKLRRSLDDEAGTGKMTAWRPVADPYRDSVGSRL